MSPSLPAWGAWIEIAMAVWVACSPVSRSPHGERGLKFLQKTIRNYLRRRSPHGERGLKLKAFSPDFVRYWSLPAWGAWIEIQMLLYGLLPYASLPAWGAWIEIEVSDDG